MKHNRCRSTIRLLATLLTGIMLLSGCTGTAGKVESGTSGQPETNPVSETNPGTETEPVTDNTVPVIEPAWENTALNGICFGLTGARSRKLDIEKLMNLMQTMQVQAMRNWMHATTVLESPTEPKESMVTTEKEWFSMLSDRGINKLVGMSHYWFLPASINTEGMTKTMARSSVPYRDTDEGSLYNEWLDMFEETWYTMAKTFPEITFWEVGNETNMDLYLHPLTYESKGTAFSLMEKTEILTDMLFAASQGIHRANPEAIVIFPGLAPVDGFSSIRGFLNQVYKNIESGNFGNGCTDPDAYFQAVAWHGYFLKESFTIDKWIDGNNSIYNVMVQHGDGTKKVFLTEFGFSDGGKKSVDAQEAEYFRQIYAHLATDMPYVDSIYPFRLVEDQNADLTEVYYGMFKVFGTDSFGAKEKAKAICELYGGSVADLDRYLGDNRVYAN